MKLHNNEGLDAYLFQQNDFSNYAEIDMMEIDRKDVYHEKQVRELCALHALNNLFQRKDMFTKLELDNICLELCPNVWVNPHRSILGLGNYDVNVIMTALLNKGYEAIWFDKRKDIRILDVEQIFGFILNIPVNLKLGTFQWPFDRRHWIAIRQIHGIYYNLDSKLDYPLPIGNVESLLEYLTYQLENQNKELFYVVPKTLSRP